MKNLFEKIKGINLKLILAWGVVILCACFVVYALVGVFGFWFLLAAAISVIFGAMIVSSIIYLLEYYG